MLPKTGVAAFVEGFAHVHNVTAKRSRLNDWAEAVSRADGDGIRLDHVELLLVALRKRDLISGGQAARLLTLHQREKNVAMRPWPRDDRSGKCTERFDATGGLESPEDVSEAHMLPSPDIERATLSVADLCMSLSRPTQAIDLSPSQTSGARANTDVPARGFT